MLTGQEPFCCPHCDGRADERMNRQAEQMPAEGMTLDPAKGTYVLDGQGSCQGLFLLPP